MVITKNITLNTHKQLVDLNGDKVNFNLTFEVKTQNGEPFQVVVVTQSILDSENEVPIEYKDAKDGYISGNIVSDKNKYENYFLLLKADKPTECTVTINLQDAPPAQQPPLNFLKEPPPPNVLASSSVNPDDTENKSKSAFPWVTVIIIALILIGGGLAWYFLIYKKAPAPIVVSVPPPVPVAAPILPAVSGPTPALAPSPVVEQSAESIRHQELLDKINSVPMWQEPL